LSEILSDPIWQGIGVIVTVIIAVISLFFSRNQQRNEERGKSEEIIQLPMTAEKEILEGQLVRLRGMVWREMFPGPPNYESIDDGDQAQPYWILNTNRKIEIFGKSMENGKPYSAGSSSRFQLMLEPSFYSNREYTVFSDVWVEGTVMIGHAGHHKTKALIDVQKLEPI